MTKMTTAPSIGKRIQAIRRHRGFATAKDLADAIPGGLLSESVLQNIEAGRKSDLSVSQLLNIARALRVSPLFLLVPLGIPQGHVDLPNLSEDVSRMEVAEFDNWVSGSPVGVYHARFDEDSERRQLEAARELSGLIAERIRISLGPVNIRELFPNFPPLTPEQEAAMAGSDTTDERIREYSRRIEELEEFLVGSGWFDGE